MNKWILVAAMLSGMLTVAGCNTISERDYAVAQKELKTNSAFRKRVTTDCVASFRKDSATKKANMAAFLDVSVARLPSVFCNRFYSALASNRISYADYLAAERNGNYAPFIKALRS